MKKNKKKHLALTGITAFTIPLIFSLIATYRAYETFFGDAAKALTRSEIKEQIISSLSNVVVWPIVGFVGSIIVAVILDGVGYREKWFFRTLTILALFWLVCLPIGSFLGGIVLIYLLCKRKSFD